MSPISTIRDWAVPRQCTHLIIVYPFRVWELGFDISIWAQNGAPNHRFSPSKWQHSSVHGDYQGIKKDEAQEAPFTRPVPRTTGRMESVRTALERIPAGFTSCFARHFPDVVRRRFTFTHSHQARASRGQ